MRIILVAFAVFSLAACAPKAAAPANNDAAVIAGATALFNEWTIAGSEGRWDDLKDLYADDSNFRWIEQGRVSYANHDDVVTGIDMAVGTGANITTHAENVSVTALGPDAAAIIADVRFEFSSEQFSFEFDGVFSGVAIKQGNAWKFLNGHLSEPMPAEESESY